VLKRSLVLVIALCVARLAGGSAGAADEPQPQARPTLFDLPDPWQADLTLSYQSLGQAGSLQRYRKYHRPADGLFLGEWALRGTTAEGFPFARLSAFGLGADDVGGSLVWHGVNVPASFRWEYDRYRFFADPITVQTPSGPIQIQPQRTNNILEQFFRALKRANRRKTGNASSSRMLRTIIADTPLVRNLEKPIYTKILFNGKASLEEVFAEINIDTLREAFRKTQDSPEKIPSKLKPLIAMSDFPEKVVAMIKRVVV